MPNTSIGDLSDIFNQQQALASNTLTPTLLGTKGDKLASLMYRVPPTIPQAPQLRFDVEANGVGEGIVKGLGNAVNNTFQMRNMAQQQARYNQYEQQQKQLFDLSMQRDLAAQQQAQQDLVRQQQFIQTLPQKLQPIYQQSDAIGKRALLAEMAKPVLTPDQKKAESDAALQANQADLNDKRQRFIAITGGFTPEQVFAQSSQGAITPQIANAYEYVYGKKLGTDALDLRDRQNQSDKLSVEAQAAPTKTAQEIEQNNLNLLTSDLNNKLKAIQVDFEPDRLQSSIEGQQLTNKEKADKLKRVDTAVQVFNAFQDRLARGEVTAQDVAQVQSTIGMLNGLDPALDTSLKRMLGLKAEDKLDDKKLKEFFKTQSQPAAQGTPRPQGMNQTKAMNDLGRAQTSLNAAAKQAGQKKQSAQSKANQVSKRIDSNQKLLAQGKNLEKEAQNQLNTVNKLLDKYKNFR